MNDKDRISQYVEDYYIDGDTGYYNPTDDERFLIEDAIRGFELIESVKLIGVQGELAKAQAECVALKNRISQIDWRTRRALERTNKLLHDCYQLLGTVTDEIQHAYLRNRVIQLRGELEQQIINGGKQ